MLDTTVPEIKFDENGICNYCYLHDKLIKRYPLGEEGNRLLTKLIEKIKNNKKSEYDCVVGVSGGTDSTFTLYLAKKLGLNPLAVHVDNGWNSELSVDNIQKTTSKLGVDLHTIVLDWDEFRDLQIAFLKASVPDGEIPTDIAIFTCLHETAVEEGVKYVINGHHYRTQGTCPKGWTYMDGKYIQSVHDKYGTMELNQYPNFTLTKLLYYRLIKRIKSVSLIEYQEYDKQETSRMLEEKLGWRSYGGKHYESIYTRFFQSHILPEKFNIDKRKVHYSAQIRSGQMKREEALMKLKKPPIPQEQAQKDKEYVIKKLGMAEGEFNEIMRAKPKTYKDYQTYQPLIKKLKKPIKIACQSGILPERFYQKYAK